MSCLSAIAWGMIEEWDKGVNNEVQKPERTEPEVESTDG